MNKEEIEQKAKAALAAAGDMAAHGAEWLKSRDWKGYGANARNLAGDLKQRIYGKRSENPPGDKGFIAFSTFRVLVTPALASILWFVGAYIVFPVIMFRTLGTMCKYRGFVSAEAFWYAILVGILSVIVFRLVLELFVHLSRIHSSAKRNADLLEELVAMEKRRASGEADGNSAVEDGN